MAYNILVVEDSSQIRETIGDFFNAKCGGTMQLFFAEDGDKGLEMVYEHEFDLVLLDIMLPKTSGFEICRELRGGSACPIIFITALGTENGILHGYELGADDYIIKPFSLAALYAKAVALIKRSKGMVRGETAITCGKISLDPITMQVKIDGEIVKLAPKEYFLLKLLLENKESVISRDTMLTKVWGYDFDGDERVVNNHIKKLRKALGKENSAVKTVFGGGYKITEK